MYFRILNLSRRFIAAHIPKRIKHVRYFTRPVATSSRFLSRGATIRNVPTLRSGSNGLLASRSMLTSNAKQVKMPRKRFIKNSIVFFGIVGSAVSVIVLYKIGVNYNSSLAMAKQESGCKFSVLADDTDESRLMLTTFSLESSISGSEERDSAITSGIADIESIKASPPEPLVVTGEPFLDQHVENVKNYIKSVAESMRAEGIDLGEQKVVLYVHGYGPGQREISTTRAKEVLDAAFDENQRGTVLTFNLTYDSFDVFTFTPFHSVRERTFDGIVPYVLAHTLLELQKEEYGWNQVSVIAHSMGNYVLCKCISLLINGNYNDYKADLFSVNKELYDQFDFSKMQFVSCAAAIDLKRLELALDDLKGIKNEHKPKKWTSYYHKKDRVLKQWDKIDRVGPKKKRFMLGRQKYTYLDANNNNHPMIECIDCSNVKKEVSGSKHSYNFENERCMDDIKQLLKDDKLHPNQRSTNLEKDGEYGVHWKFAKMPGWWSRLFSSSK